MRIILSAIVISIMIVSVSYLGFSWYYKRYDVKPFEVKESTQYVPPPTLTNKTQELLQSPIFRELDDEPMTLNSETSIVTDANEMQSFTDFVMNHPFNNQPKDKIDTLLTRYYEAEGDVKIEIGMEMLDYYMSFHDFMTGLMKRYAEKRIPIRADSDEFAIISQAIDTYIDFVETSNDPFLLNNTSQPRERSPEVAEMARKYDEWKRSQ